jgi:putative colanic acid biosynthesis UDP-glucose lipid carrier transferase
MLRTHERKLALLQRVFDCVCIAAAHVVACHVYSRSAGVPESLATAIAVLVFLFLSETGNLYRRWRTAPMQRELAKVWSTWILVLPVLLLIAMMGKVSADYSRVVTGIWFLLVPLSMSAWRVAARIALRRLRSQGRNTRTVAIAGATEVASQIVRRIVSNPWYGMRLAGYYDDRNGERAHEMPPEAGGWRGSLDDLVAVARRRDVDVVYVALPLRAESRIHSLVAKLADTTASVFVVADFMVFDLLHAEWSEVDGMPVVSVFESPFYGVDGWLKRIEDLVVGTLICTLIALPMALIALGIKLTSPGPVFFRQRRYGLKGQEIRVLKFRTMTVCEDGAAVRQATRNDSRVTPFGALLRKTSLDELPQFLQVITGEMSIVGPRPHAVAHNEEYRRLIHGYMLRHKVKPGITGWAQINGWRGETDTLEKMSKRVEHDLDYIRNWSLLWDLQIIFWTIFRRTASRNAY